MKEVKLPVGKKPSLKMISIRISENHQKKIQRVKIQQRYED
jgi:hypothetical protein